ncbi:MAG: hypothetical protein OEZ36_05930 [Spirochaetota bacterium]|nr:hypothetical protein [Spirochaetota bacterium]
MLKAPLAIFVFILLFHGVYCVKPRHTIPGQSDKTSKEIFYDFYKNLPKLRPIKQNAIHTLRVLFVEDHSLPALSPKQKSALLRETELLTKRLLGYNIHLSDLGGESIRSFFSSMDKHFKNPSYRYLISELPIDLTDERALRHSISQQVRDYSNSFLIRYFGNIRQGVLWEDHITNRFIWRLKSIQKEKDHYGRELYNTDRLNHRSLPHWIVAAMHLKKADFVITNTVIAGARQGMPIYVIKRGGLTSAFVTYNLHNPFQAAGILPTYQFLSQSAFFRWSRGNLPADKMIRVMSHVFVHELGHFLLRVPEQYNPVGSIHIAPRDLNYYRWYRRIRPELHPFHFSRDKLLKRY